MRLQRGRGEREERLTEYELLGRGEHVKGECNFVLVAFSG